jgi:hypothetical protein
MDEFVDKLAGVMAENLYLKKQLAVADEFINNVKRTKKKIIKSMSLKGGGKRWSLKKKSKKSTRKRHTGKK